MSNITEVSHPIVQSKISELRNSHTSSHRFRALIKEITTVVGIEATRNLPLKDVQGLHSPIDNYTGKAIAPRIGLSPILRAGIGMTDPMLDLFPDASVFYLGLFREKVSLQPVEYYQKLPPQPTVDTLYLLDPLVATGGTAIAAVSILLDWGLQISQIKLLSILGSKQGLDKVAAAYPGLQIFTCAVDEVLTEDGYVRPGVGDTGDRLFNTK